MYRVEEIYNNIIQGDSLEVLQQFPDKCIHSVITSPPYYKQRNYEVEGQLGQEKTVKEYVDNLCNIFDEIKRVLRDDGTIFVNIGDKYIKGNMQNAPHRFAIEMQNRGWCQRNEIIWKKKGGLPESVKSRFSNCFEYIFMFTKKPSKYFFEQQFEPYKESSLKRYNYGLNLHAKSPYKYMDSSNLGDRMGVSSQGKNKTNIWEITTANLKEAHFATFPEKLVESCLFATPAKVCHICGKGLKKLYKTGDSLEEVKRNSGADSNGNYKGQSQKNHNEKNVQNASDVKRRVLESMKERIFIGYEKCDCSVKPLIDKEDTTNQIHSNALILDPFIGSGTTALSCKKHSRDYVGIELNYEYIKIIEKRLKAAFCFELLDSENT